MYSILNVLVTLCILLKWSNQTLHQEYAARKHIFNDIKIDKYILWSEQGLTAIYCAVKCLRDPRCHTFQRERTTGTCIGLSTSFASPSKLYSQLETVSGFQMFLMDSAANYIGDACVTNSDCHVTKSMCYDGICICKLGYMFSPSELKCNADDCVAWSNDFTRYVGTGSWSDHERIIKPISEAGCLRKCLEANDFTCVRSDYKIASSKCYLGSSSYGIEPAEREGTWTYFQRNCLP